MQDEFVIEAEGLTKVFRDFWGRPKARAVNGIDFKIRKGEVFGLLGPNGSGKSTTVKMILGLLFPTRGTLKVFGKNPQDVDIKTRIGYLPEETYLYKYLTAFETLDFFGALFGQPEEMRKDRAKQLLEMVGLSHAFHRPVGEFSKGMARRIGLAQALVNDPDLIILDEPTSGLDPIGCREVKDVIRLLASRGKTILLCSHLLGDVQDVCDNMLVLYGGKIQANGQIADLLKEEDKVRIVTPSLPEDTMKDLQKFLAEHGIANPADITIDHPVKNLEDFFLEIVRQAQAQNTDTAGAQSGGVVPEYLSANSDKTAILDALRRKEPSEEEAAAKAEPPMPQEVVDNAKLQQLAGFSSASKETPAPQPEPAKEETDAEAEARQKAANERLQAMFRK